MKSFITSVLLVASTTLFAQNVKIPALSPNQSIEQEFSLSKINLNYSRPSARGRKVFGDVVPFGKIWRTGANKATTIKFGEDVTINGQAIKAGEYSLSTIPEENEWTIIINSNTNLWGASGYKQEEDVLRFKTKVNKLTSPIETFTIDFEDITTTSTNIVLKWENVSVSFKVQTAVNQDAIIMASIEEAMKTDKKPYFQAANYYFQTKRDMKQALTWVSEACKADTNAFYMEHLRAKIYVELKDLKAALASAEKSKALAIRANNADYIKNNDNLIADIKKKK